MLTSTFYFSNALATIRVHPSEYVHFTYQAGTRESQDVQAVLTHTGELLVNRQWHRLLNDQRLMTPFTSEERTQVFEYWQQQTRRLGYGLCVASILAQDVFSRLAATQLRHELKEANLSYRVFDEEKEAIAWLLQQTERPPLTYLMQ